MDEIHRSVALGIAAVYELRCLEPRDEFTRDVIKGAMYAYFFLMDTLIKEHQITEEALLKVFIELGYTEDISKFMLQDYEEWAKHIVVKEIDYT